jgi:hypothetical protein
LRTWCPTRIYHVTLLLECHADTIGVISDGVVTFDSANLEYAKQTFILRGAGHGGVVSDSRAVAWIINLLRHKTPQKDRYDAAHR